MSDPKLNFAIAFLINVSLCYLLYRAIFNL